MNALSSAHKASILVRPVLCVLRCVLVSSLFLFAQNAAAASDDIIAQASDINVSGVSLERYVLPLTAAELSDLANTWQGHLSGSLEEFVSLNSQLEGVSEAQASALRNQIAENSEVQVVIAENYQLVLDSWSSKGGSVEETQPHQQYLKALSAATLRATDIRTLASLAWSWLGSKDGGLGLLVQVLVFVVALIILLFVARFVRRLAARGLDRVPSMSRLLKSFVLTVVYWITVALGLMIALGIAGVNVTPLFAVFGGLSFILGFALQDTLGNLASGLMIMVLKPFDTGDYIEISGASGTVDAMSVVSTQIRTFDNQYIVVPNSKIWGDVITNVSAAKTRRVDLVFGIAYSDNAPAAVEVLKEMVAADSRCMTDPAPEIFVGELGDSSVNLFCRPWVATEDYWDVYWGLTGAVKERFDKEGISIPFPQRDVHLIPVEN